MYSKRKLQKKKLFKLFIVTLTFKLYIFFKVKYRVKTFQKYYFSKEPPQSLVMKILGWILRYSEYFENEFIWTVNGQGHSY